MKNIMMDNVGIYRRKAEMESAVQQLRDLRQATEHVQVDDTSKAYNTDLLELLELQNLLDLAIITAACANSRKESRGAHYRSDFPQTNDESYRGNFYFQNLNGRLDVQFRPVQPVPRRPRRDGIPS